MRQAQAPVLRTGNRASELLWPQHRDEEVNKQSQCDEADKKVFHGSKLSTRVRVKDGNGEKREGHDHENQVLHAKLLQTMNTL